MCAALYANITLMEYALMTICVDVPCWICVGDQSKNHDCNNVNIMQ